MANLDIIQEVVIQARTEGVQKTISDLDRLAAAEDRVVDGENQLVVATDKTTKARLSAAPALDRLQKQLDAEYRAVRQVAEANKVLDRARSQGLISIAEHARLTGLAAQRHDEAAGAARRASAANDNLAKSTGVAGHHIQNLGYQLSDVATSLAGGASPFMVMSQQAGQILPILAETGVAGAVKGVGSAIARFLTPAVLTVGALTGAVVYGYSAWSRYDDESRKVGTTLAGLGRQTGLTNDQFEELARTTAAVAGLTVRQSSELMTAFAATGRIGPDNLKRLAAVSKDFAATFGTDLDSIKDKLASAFSSPEGITRLNEQLRFLDARTKSTIDGLFRQGKEQDAIRLAIEKLPAALARSEEAQGAVARGWKAIKDAASDADQAVGRAIDRIVKGPSPAQKIAELKAKVEYERQAADERLVQPGSVSRTYVPPTAPTVASTSPVPPGRPQELQSYEEQLRRALEARAELTRKEEEAAQNKALEESLNRKSGELKKLTEEAGLGTEQWRQYRDLQIAADDALKSGDPALMKRVDSVKDLKEAASVLEQVVKSTTAADGERMTQAERVSRQNAVELSSIRATTVEGRARVAAQRQEEQQRGQLITRQQAQIQVEQAAAVVREQSNQQLRDTLRDQALEGDEIRKRIALLGVDAETRAVTIARQREEQALVRQGVDLQSELAQKVLAGAEANARLGVAFDRAADAQQRMRDGTRQIGQDFATFIDDALLGTGKLEDAFKSLAKSFSSNTLSAVLTGQGPLAGLLGTAPTERGQLGGLLAGQLNLGSLFNTREIEKAVAAGSETGNASFWEPWLKPSNSASGQSMGVLSSPLGKGALSVGAGAAIGYQSQSPLMGAMGGALAGLATGNPLLAAAGPALGYGGAIGKRRPSAEAPKPQETPTDDRDKRLLAA